MKKKLIYKYGVIFILVALMATIISIGFIRKINPENKTSVVAVHESKDSKFSALFGGNVLFSAEKVLIDSEGDEVAGKTFLGDNGSKYSFVDYTAAEKYVIENNQFVKLENRVDATSGKLINKDGKQITTVAGSSSFAQDAVLVSFGHYILMQTGNTVSTSQENSQTTVVGDYYHDTITRLQVSGEHNGQPLEDLTRRDIIAEGGPYFDFVYLIKQEEGAEGYYKFTFDYTKSGSNYVAEFEFYIIFDTSYTQVKDTNVGYNAKPTLGWIGDGDVFEKTTIGSAPIRYFDGESGIYEEDATVTNKNAMDTISYPTLTYDYTRYKMGYTHISNNITTTYDYSFKVEYALNSQKAVLTITKTTATGSTVKTQTMKYDADGINLVTIMFTEPGEYSYTFDYIYKGYNEAVAPAMNLEVGPEVANKKLIIGGIELEYSKVNFQSARLRHYVISTDQASNVNLVIANGCEYGKESESGSSQLEFVYTLDSSSSARAGQVIKNFDEKNGSRDALINAQLMATDSDEAETEINTNDFDYITSNVKDSTKETTLSKVLNNINYVKTNQGSFWFSLSDTYTNNSFYFYSANKLTASDLFVDNGGTYETTAVRFTNQTSLNTTGYYLVFMQVETLDKTHTYWHVYAFQYSTDTVDIKAVTKDGNIETPVSAYTNKNVTITWADPDVFEKKLTGYYIVASNNNASKEEMLKGREYPLKSGDTLGSTVAKGNFAKFLIKIQSEGQSASYKMFTVDRSDIQDVYAYVVKSSTSASGARVYSVHKNTDGSKMVLKSGITDSIVTLNWQEANNGYKNSGAGINAEYYYIPFVENNENIVISQNNWISTNYELGSQLGPFADYVRPEGINQLSYSSLFSKQGIYRVILTDEAGNSCQYMFVIDKTESYYKVEDGFYTEQTLIYGDTVQYTVGSHKNLALKQNVIGTDDSIPLSDIDAKTGDYVNTLMNIANGTATAANLYEQGYYIGTGSNYKELATLFRKDNSGQTHLLVQHLNLEAYDSQGNRDTYLKLTGEINKESLGHSSSVVRNLYLHSKNTQYSSLLQGRGSTNSYLTIEVNPDNSRGTVYFTEDANATIPTNGYSTSTVIRLYTGSDNTNYDGTVDLGDGILGAHATSSKHVTFTWKLGVGDQAVQSITYQRYKLNQNSYNSKFFYYEKEGDVVTAYKDNVFYEENGARKDVANENGFVSFDKGGSTPEGLYIVTRTYVGSGSESDSKYKNYYFIVDRKQVIDVGVGESINVKLLEDETVVTDFSKYNVDTYSLTFNDINGIERENIPFGVYLTTNKVPATLSIPKGKYFDGSNISDYFAGRLTFSLYYFESVTSDPQLIYRDEKTDNDPSADVYYDLNVSKYLEEHNKELKKKMIVTDSNNNVKNQWICLPGIYVMLIEDHTEKVEVSGATNNRKLIGFEIKQNKFPTIGLQSGYVAGNLNSAKVEGNNGSYALTTNAEFIEFTIPAYDRNAEQAQLDGYYLIVKQFINGVEQGTYISRQYGNVPISEKYTLRDDGSFDTIYLNTMLHGLKQSDVLRYEITVRFRLGKYIPSPEGIPNRYVLEGKGDRYINAYKMLNENGTLTNYYESTYSITIDRLAPDKNVNALVARDADFIKFYNEENGVDEMFVDSYHKTNSTTYYTKQYNAYYATTPKSMSKVYVFRVNANTKFEIEENARVKYKILNHNLTLPVINENEYTTPANSRPTTYGELFGTSTGIYEVLELDKAGNITQYVVNYTNDPINFAIGFSVEKTDGDGESVDLRLTDAGDSLSVFRITGLSISEHNNDFYRIVVTNHNESEIYSINTNRLTDFVVVAKEIANIMTLAGAGNYWLTVITPENVLAPAKFNINLYDKDSDVTLNITQLIYKNGDDYYINLSGANRKVDGIWYYANTVIVNDVEYQGKITNPTQELANNAFEYYLEGVKVDHLIKCTESSYKIVIYDILNNRQTIRFNTSGTNQFYTITDADGDTARYYQDGDTYYSFDTINITFDTTIFKTEEVLINYTLIDGIVRNDINATVSGYDIKEHIIKEEGAITLYPIQGDYIEIIVIFSVNEDGDPDEYYKIVLDSRIGNVELKEYLTGDNKDVSEGYNVEDYKDVLVDSLTAGIMNLTWDRSGNGDFNYTYLLYQDDNVDPKILSGDYETITTDRDSDGRYWLVVEVYSQDNSCFLGNKVFAFQVKAVNNQLYYIQIDGEEFEPNSSFTKNELSGLMTLPDGVNIPLYIINTTEYKIVQIEDENVTRELIYTYENSGDSLKVYKINNADSYSVYFGVLVIKQSDEIVSNLKVNVNGVEFATFDSESYSLTISAQADATISLTGARTSISGHDIIRKNILLIDIYYNTHYVQTVTYQGNVYGEFEHEMLGNGTYYYVFRDLAGNVQKFENSYSHTDDKSAMEFLVLREIILRVKGQSEDTDYVPIENAFYSEPVEMRLYSSYIYVNGSISIKVTRNGRPYGVGNTSPYVFRDYGSYRVTVKAVYLAEGERKITLSKTFAFTIVNEKEARKSIDLTSLNGYNITQVLNTNGEDCTEAFKTHIINVNSGINSSYIDYEKIMTYADEINATFGKNTFAITYEVEDEIYPKREVTFRFTLNNETPKIDCSLEKGESTTKGFDISFNAGIIYEQIGEAYIYINNKVVAEINEFSSYDIQTISTTFKENGAGDYYVKLVTASGNVLSSYKLTIKEPLNVWAIIIIVVVSVIVITVTTVIIVLRHKMKIR